MPAEVDSDLKLEIAHVLTIDVVAYSTLLIHEQTRIMAELTRVVRSTVRFRSAEAEGKLTRLPTGDGMALVFFGDPEAPLECAMQISTELRSRPEIRLRMGIHSGPVNQVIDVNDRSNVAGAGIDMAQRVMDCGDAGHILVSKRVADDLAPYSRWNHCLHELGEVEVKHGRKISVFNFYTGILGNPNRPMKCREWNASARPGILLLHRKLLLSVVGLLVLILAVSTARLLRTSSNEARSVAVLPFRDLSQAKDQDYFTEGITEQIINSLGKIRGLLVVARSSVFVFKDQKQDIKEIGRRLRVTHALEGSVSRDGAKIRVDTTLVDISNGYQVWAESYNANDHDILSLQSDVAKKVAKALEVKLQLSESTQLAKIPTSDPEAYDLYLRGRYQLNKRTTDSVQHGLSLFEQAVALDPRFASGRTGIADSYVLLGKIGALSARDAALRAWPEVLYALAIDDQLADAYVSRATLLNDFDWNSTAAEADYQKALSLDPNSAAAHHWYARHLAQLGRSREAIREIDAARRLDPLSPSIRVTLAKVLVVARRYDEALNACKSALELEPNFAPAFSLLAQAHALRGDHALAISAAKRYVELSSGNGWSRLELAFAYAVAGQRKEADQIVAEATARADQFSPYDMATVSAARRDGGTALKWIEQAIQQRSVDVIWIRVDPRLDQIRSLTNFDELVGKMQPKR